MANHTKAEAPPHRSRRYRTGEPCSTPNQCALQRAYQELKKRGDTQAIADLTSLLNDHTVTTRNASAEIRNTFDIVLTHNSVTAHRTGSCIACQRAAHRAAQANPTKAAKRTAKTKANNPGIDPAVLLAAAAADVKIHNVAPSYPTEPVDGPRSHKSHMKQDEEGNVIIKDVPLYVPLTIEDDLSPLLVQFGLSPDKYEVVRDTFSMWMQSASDGAGGRDVTYLYAAKFRRVGSMTSGVPNKDALKQWRSVMLKTSKTRKPVYPPRQESPAPTRCGPPTSSWARPAPPRPSRTSRPASRRVSKSASASSTSVSPSRASTSAGVATRPKAWPTTTPTSPTSSS